MSKYLWLIRHGESEGNLERRIQGWQDFPLTNRGRRQAARLAERLAEEAGIEAIITSPLARAATTAEIIGAVLGCLGMFGVETTSFAAVIGAAGVVSNGAVGAAL